MAKWKKPPGRNSNLLTPMTQPLGPHHNPSRSASLQAFQTRPRGAAKRRVMVSTLSISFSPLGAGLDFMQIGVQPVETVFPKMFVDLDPARRVLQRRRLQLAGPRLRRPAS